MDQRSFVAAFLVEVFGGAEHVPAADLSSEENVRVLFRFARDSVLATQAALEERNDNRVRAEEYAAETMRKGALLDAVQLAPEHLGTAARAALSSLARVAVLLRDPVIRRRKNKRRQKLKNFFFFSSRRGIICLRQF